MYLLTNAISNNDFIEYTVCDFNLQIGDTLENYFGFNNSEHTLIVDAIKIDENSRRVYYMNDGSYYTAEIGKNEGNLNIYFNLVDGTYERLHCFGDAENPNNCATVLSSEKNSLSYIKIYPNPVDNFLSINTTTNTTLKIYSINGVQLLKTTSKSNFKIDVSTFSSGIYILEISNLKGIKRNKFLKI